MRWWTLAILGSLGCTRVFGIENTELLIYDDAAPAPDGDPRIDLDLDGIKDVEDPCIAPDTDLLANSDGDFVSMMPLPNGIDPCPFEPESSLASGTPIDSDGDGIGDACDPTPIAGDRVRCIMAFTDPDLDVAMWQPRDGVIGWEVNRPKSLTALAFMPGSIIADWPFEGPGVTTYHVNATVYVGKPAPTVRFDAFARAGRASSDADAGCSVIAGSPWVLATSDGVTAPVTIGTTTDFKELALDVTVIPVASGGPTLRCRARFDGGAVAQVSSTVALPPGNLAFAANGTASISGVTIYERDDAPP